ncbi:MAG: alpha/beta hydrolase [Chloroflexi bacterium]|nr:alpha/beta hydrolase [Chloroflexota bacterium]
MRLHYVTAGRGKLIMFLHGFPEFWYGWKNQLKEFGRDYQAVAPDMRGYNLSSAPPEVDKYQTKYLVEDIRLLAEHLGHKNFVLVGHDWGGAVAWTFALRHPDLLEKLIIINAPHPFVFDCELRQNLAQQKASSYMLMFRSPKAEQILSENNYASLVDTVLTDGLKEGYFNEEDRKAYIEAWSQPGALTGGLNYYRAASLGGLTGGGKEASASTTAETSQFVVKVPTLVIWGENDRYLLKGNLEGLDEWVSDLTIERVAEGSHWVVHERTELVNRLMREFIE